MFLIKADDFFNFTELQVFLLAHVYVYIASHKTNF